MRVVLQFGEFGTRWSVGCAEQDSSRRADTVRLVTLPLKLATSRAWGAYAFLFEQIQHEDAQREKQPGILQLIVGDLAADSEC